MPNHEQDRSEWISGWKFLTPTEDRVMAPRGFSHIGLATLVLDKTREFYEGVLGFKPVVADTIKVEEGGNLRHIFFDIGRDQLIAFLEPRGVPDVRKNGMWASTAGSVFQPASII